MDGQPGYGEAPIVALFMQTRMFACFISQTVVFSVCASLSVLQPVFSRGNGADQRDRVSPAKQDQFSCRVRA